MKKILFILGFVSLLVAGCSDFFDTAPSNKIPTTMAFRTVTDVDNAVNGLYDLMSGSGYYGAAMFAYGDMKEMICRVLRKVGYAIHAICSIIVLIV